MPSSTALRDHLNLFETSGVTLTLAQISVIIGWSPPGEQSTAAYVGAPGKPTPFVRNISAAMADGWTVTNSSQPGRITFTRKSPPRAPTLIAAPPRPLPPTLDAFVHPPIPQRSVRAASRTAKTPITDPASSDRAAS